jgi:hypothetical protein
VDVILDWDPVDQAETYRVDIRNSDDGGTTWNIMPNISTDDTQATVSVNPKTRYQWRVRARQYDIFGELDGESRSDWKEFSTYDIYTMGGNLQYQTYSDDSHAYHGHLVFTKNKNPIEESDIDQETIELKDSEDKPVLLGAISFNSGSSFRGVWNDSTSRVDYSGLLTGSGFNIKFPGDKDLSAGNYTYKATTREGDPLTLTRDFPGPMELPVVDVASMSYEWLDDGGLRLTWSVPDGDTYDALLIVLSDKDENGLIRIRLPADKDEVTIQSEWIQQITDLKNPSAAIWHIQTHASAADGNNYARGSSGNVEFDWK